MITVIIPVYNEKDGFRDTVAAVQAQFQDAPDAEIILVDDGSTDGTSERIRESFPHVTLIRHGVNRGYGAAIKSGLRAARGDLVGIIDADGTYPADALKRFAGMLRDTPDLDMVVGARDWTPPSRRLAKFVLRQLAKTLVGRDIPDLNSGLRVFRREWAMRFIHLFPDGFSLTTTQTLAMLSNGASLRYEPIHYARRTGRSKIAPIADTLNFLTLIIRCVLYFNPIKVLLPIAALLFAAGTVTAVWTLLATGRIADITVMTCYFLSIQIGVLAFLADMIAKRSQ